MLTGLIELLPVETLTRNKGSSEKEKINVTKMRERERGVEGVWEKKPVEGSVVGTRN